MWWNPNSLFAQELRRLNLRDRRRRHEQETLSRRFLGSYWREVAESAGVGYEDLGHGFHRLTADGRWTMTYRGRVMLDDGVALAMAGHKPLMYRLVKEWGFGECVPRHRVVHYDDVTQARAMLDEGILVAKPAAGTGAGMGVTTQIATLTELRRAMAVAGRYDPDVLVEEQVQANCYRLLYLDSELIDAVWRRNPTVVGNGADTIGDLIDRENEQRIRAPQLRALWLISKDAAYRNQLRQSGLSPRSRPPAGQVVTVKNVVNQNNALENERVTRLVHPTVAARCAEICRAARLRFAGVDLLMQDITAPWGTQRAIVNDINTTPGLHHHVLTTSGSDNHCVGVAIVNRLLERSQAVGDQPLVTVAPAGRDSREAKV
jgi:cyanophycin synthetase